MNYNYAGYCCFMVGHFEEALEHYDLAYTYIRKVTSDWSVVVSLHGEILFHRG
jgi:hypothetical protein